MLRTRGVWMQYFHTQLQYIKARTILASTHSKLRQCVWLITFQTKWRYGLLLPVSPTGRRHIAMCVTKRGHIDKERTHILSSVSKIVLVKMLNLRLSFSPLKKFEHVCHLFFGICASYFSVTNSFLTCIYILLFCLFIWTL